jgi:pseudolysin
MKKSLVAFSALFVALPVIAAVSVDLSHQPFTLLAMQQHPLAVQEQSRATDFNGTLHIRVAQTYQGYPVWGSDSVIHIPKAGTSTRKWQLAVNAETFMNGTLYQQLHNDLNPAPAYIFGDIQSQRALNKFIAAHHDKALEKQSSQLMVYVDANNKAHWAYQISFLIPGSKGRIPQKPVYIVDAVNFIVYTHWDEVQTQQALQQVKAGGYIGNHKTGQKKLDGLNGNPQPLIVQRDEQKKICYMKNENLILYDISKSMDVMQFSCNSTNAEHNNVYWNSSHDKVETTWSPSNDVMFGLEITRKLYQEWYGLPVWIRDGKPRQISALVHDPDTNAYWTGEDVMFGDSKDSEEFNPFTQLDTVAHEVSHGFTAQHSRLVSEGQPGALNESFSDIVGIAAEYYTSGSTKFLVGWGDLKADGKAMRYMDKPSRDCDGREPGDACSIDHYSQYDSRLDPHQSCGIFNHFYYQLANTPDWNPRKALDVLMQANTHYWTRTISFVEAACGVMQATRDYQYDEKAVASAFQSVGIDTALC